MFHCVLIEGKTLAAARARPWKESLTDTQAPCLYFRKESYNAKTDCVLDVTVLCVKYKGIAFLIIFAILDVQTFKDKVRRVWISSTMVTNMIHHLQYLCQKQLRVLVASDNGPQAVLMRHGLGSGLGMSRLK